MQQVNLPVSRPSKKRGKIKYSISIAAMYTVAEKVFIVECYLSHRSCVVVSREFKKKFLKRVTKSYIYFLVRKFRKNGTLLNNYKGRRTVISTELTLQIRHQLTEGPGNSIRKVARRFPEVSNSTVYKVAKKYLKLHPYKMRLVHEIKPQDYPKRVQFAQWFLDEEDMNGDYVFFSDESNFYTDGTVNGHNFIYWSSEKPEDHFRESSLCKAKVGVWAAMSKSFLYGPYFYEDNMNANKYKEIILEFYADLLANFADNLPLV